MDSSVADNKPSGDGNDSLNCITEGSYKALQVSIRTVIIHRGHLVERVTIDRVTPAPAPLNPPEENRYAKTPEDLAKKIPSGDAWLMDGILKHRRKRDQCFEFFLQWSGDHEPKWEPRMKIPEELISRYFAQAQDPYADETPTARVWDKQIPPTAQPEKPATSPRAILRC